MKYSLYIISVILIATLSSCKKQTNNVVSDHRIVQTADPYLPLMQQQADQFMSLYPKVKIEVQSATTREAIVNLLNDSVSSIVIDRQFNKEENQVIKQASIRIIENIIAKDGIAIIVHKQNPISNISVESVRKIVSSVVINWEQISGSRINGSIDFVLTGLNSGMHELLQNKIMLASKKIRPTAVVENQKEVIQYVSNHLQSVGFVAASLVINGKEGIKVLPVISRSPEGKEKEYLPGQQEIYTSLYPFQYSLYLYNTEAKAPVGIGFSAFIMSNIGQTIIQKASMVPASIPYRTIQLTAE